MLYATPCGQLPMDHHLFQWMDDTCTGVSFPALHHPPPLCFFPEIRQVAEKKARCIYALGMNRTFLNASEKALLYAFQIWSKSANEELREPCFRFLKGVQTDVVLARSLRDILDRNIKKRGTPWPFIDEFFVAN